MLKRRILKRSGLEKKINTFNGGKTPEAEKNPGCKGVVCNYKRSSGIWAPAPETGHEQLGSCKAGTNTTFCPTFPEQQPSPCWGGKPAPYVHMTERVANKVSESETEKSRAKATLLLGLKYIQVPRSIMTVIYSVSSVTQ